ncbi:MAG: toll/interleukin-1 receptor domain-containing protein, partial [Gammaproteobacteria bacterium]
MAYVPGYKNDIFVSYAHVDNIPFSGMSMSTGWVETFIDNLTKKLAQKIGRTDLFKLWDDRLLAQNAPLTPEILDALKGSAILVLVLSPGYLKSPWCQREKNAFYDLLRSKNRSSNSVFVVHRDRVERESCPEEIRDLLGFRFWEERSKGREPRIAGEPVPQPTDSLYWDELSDLAGKLSHGLEQLRGSAPIEPGSGLVPARDPTEAPAKQAKVFLAEVSDDLYKLRKKLLGALEQAGAEVFPKAPYPLTVVEYEQALGRDLGGCSLFVQLLSDLPGRELHGSTKTIVTAQFELARSLDKAIIQWRERELDLNEVEEESQRQILEGPSVMAISLEELQSEVLKKAFPKPRESHAPVSTTGDTLVFVHSDAIDQALVEEICMVLGREQIGWVIPSETESPERVRHEFEDLLLGCDALMLIYGQSPGGWVRQQLMNCRKLQHKRETPLRALAVFEGPPTANKGELGISLPSLRKLVCHQ